MSNGNGKSVEERIAIWNMDLAEDPIFNVCTDMLPEFKSEFIKDDFFDELNVNVPETKPTAIIDAEKSGKPHKAKPGRKKDSPPFIPPEGWRTVEYTRKSGKRQGFTSRVFYSPDGMKFTSVKKARAHVEKIKKESESYANPEEEKKE